PPAHRDEHRRRLGRRGRPRPARRRAALRPEHHVRPQQLPVPRPEQRQRLARRRQPHRLRRRHAHLRAVHHEPRRLPRVPAERRVRGAQRGRRRVPPRPVRHRGGRGKLVPQRRRAHPRRPERRRAAGRGRAGLPRLPAHRRGGEQPQQRGRLRRPRERPHPAAARGRRRPHRELQRLRLDDDREGERALRAGGRLLAARRGADRLPRAVAPAVVLLGDRHELHRRPAVRREDVPRGEHRRAPPGRARPQAGEEQELQRRRRARAAALALAHRRPVPRGHPRPDRTLGQLHHRGGAQLPRGERRARHRRRALLHERDRHAHQRARHRGQLRRELRVVRRHPPHRRLQQHAHEGDRAPGEHPAGAGRPRRGALRPHRAGAHRGGPAEEHHRLLGQPHLGGRDRPGAHAALRRGHLVRPRHRGLAPQHRPDVRRDVGVGRERGLHVPARHGHRRRRQPLRQLPRPEQQQRRSAQHVRRQRHLRHLPLQRDLPVRLQRPVRVHAAVVRAL
ncbi:MAG: TonB-dependent receptor, partial [uncultured Gemmatimonadaceae bacterium]